MHPVLRLLSMALVLFGVNVSTAKAQFTLSAEVRPRTEFRNGFKTPTADENEPAFFTEQRSRLYLDYREEKYQFKLALQDVRIWGEQPQIFKHDNGNTFLSEAWGRYFFRSDFSVKLGRQIISYDNQRFLGGLEWAQQGRRHDALLLIYEDQKKKTKLHLAIAMNSDDDVAEPAYLQSPSASFYSVRGSYKNLMYGWFNQEFANGSISLLALNAQFQNLLDSTTFSKQTFGTNVNYGLGKLVLASDFYYQRGSLPGGDLSAVLAGLNLTYKTKITPLKLGFEYISGQNDGETDGKLHAFSPDFGTNHAHNGFMDYFFVGPANGNIGVTDIYLKTKFVLGKGSLVVNFHEFLTGSKQLDDVGTKLSSPMAFEIDMVYGRQLAPNVTLNLGYSFLSASETMLALRPGNQKANSWAWMMVTFKPTLLKTESE